MIIVTGGTGSVGRALLRGLQEERPGAAADVVAVVRRPADLDGVAQVRGDLADPPSVAAHLSAGDRLFLNAAPFPGFVASFRAVIDLAGAAGVAQVVTVSVRGARPGAPLSGGLHGEVDEHLRASGVPHAILQPSAFMQNLLRDLEGDRFHGSWGPARMNYIDARDIGDVAAALLTGPVPASGDHLLTGPQALTHDQIAGLMSAALGREIRYVDLPVPELAARLAAAGVPEPFASDLPLQQSRAADSGWDEVTTAVRDLTGRPPRTLAEFLADHADALAARAG